MDAQATLFGIPELLGMIFEYCLPEEELPTDNPLVPPRLFTQVCRMWRDVAFATPHLWARLDLVCFPSIPCRMLADRHFSTLSNWLARSGNCPTSLALRYLGSSASDVRNITKILSAIIPLSHRWRELSVTAPMPCLRPLLGRLGHATPSLETCRVTITSANAPSEREDLVLDIDNTIAFRLNPIILNLSVAPKLKQLYLMTDALTDVICVGLPDSLQTLNLSNFGLLLGPPGLKLNFCCTNLRQLTLRSNIHLPLLRQLAEAFPLLEDAFLSAKHGLEMESVSEVNRASIRFPKLRSLTVRAISTRGEVDLHTLGVCLGVLDVPSLARLSLTVGCVILDRTWMPLMEHLARVGSSLKELSFIGAYFTDDEFLVVLREIPQLETLKMCARLSHGILSALTVAKRHHEESQDFAPALCPNLRHLDIPLGSPCFADPVIGMILSRCPAPSRVDSCQESPAITKKVRSSLTSLQECRLVLSHPGVIELIENHPDIVNCVERGLRLDLRAF